jgi:diketogulonate reductase-like aldo/keto reductase
VTRHDDPEAGIKEALQELGLDYLDMFLVHWPVGNSTGKTSFDHVAVRNQYLLPC